MAEHLSQAEEHLKASRDTDRDKESIGELEDAFALILDQLRSLTERVDGLADTQESIEKSVEPLHSEVRDLKDRLSEAEDSSE